MRWKRKGKKKEEEKEEEKKIGTYPKMDDGRKINERFLWGEKEKVRKDRNRIREKERTGKRERKRTEERKKERKGERKNGSGQEWKKRKVNNGIGKNKECNE